MPAQTGEMKKTLGGLEVFAISSGAMISSGLFILPALVFRIGGPAIILAYLLAAVLVVPAVLAKAELATAMPKAGGEYFFIHRSLGPLFGTFAGFASSCAGVVAGFARAIWRSMSASPAAPRRPRFNAARRVIQPVVSLKLMSNASNHAAPAEHG